MEAQLQALMQQLQAQQAAIAALQQAQQANQQLLQAQAQQQPAAPQAVQFALTPARARAGVVDMSDSAGIKLHKQVVTPLTTPFDGSLTNLQTFLEGVKQRAKDSGWSEPDGRLFISNQATVNPQDYNLITHHRMITLENVRAHAADYVAEENRRAQDAYWMYEFLRDSLSDAARIRISVESPSYIIQEREDVLNIRGSARSLVT